MKTVIYMSKSTGECWESKDKAMEAYRAGDEIRLMDWSDTLDCWVCRGEWVH